MYYQANIRVILCVDKTAAISHGLNANSSDFTGVEIARKGVTQQLTGQVHHYFGKININSIKNDVGDIDISTWWSMDRFIR